MATRVVEWKKPYTWWEAIDINQNKVISLKLRDENNLIIYDSWDDEIYVDLQLADWIEPTDAFPVWVTTGRVLVADWWDVAGTLLNAKTTSGDYIQILFGDNGKVFMDNGTWTFKEVSFKWDVPIASTTAPSNATEWMLWYDTANDKLKVYNGSAWVTVWWGWGWTGDVEWPNSAVDGNLAVFDGTSWKIIKDWWAIPVVPTNVSDFNNDAWYLTSSTWVTSVNGNTWAVTWLQSQHSAIPDSLIYSRWSNNTQIITVSWVTANSTVIVSPAPSSISDYANCGVYCSAQWSWTLTFTCNTTPTNDIDVNIVILN